MSIKSFKRFTNETGVTKVQTTGTVTNAAGLESYVTTTSGVTWDTCGFYTAGQAIVEGDLFFVKFRKRIQNSTACVVGVTKEPDLDIGGQSASFYMNATNLTCFVFNTVFGASTAMTIDTFYYGKINLAAAIQLFINTTSFTSAYTQLGADASVGYGSDTVHFQCNALGAHNDDEGDVAVFYFTSSDGLPAVPTGLSATATGQTTADISWNAVTGADTYTLSRDGSSIVTQAGLTYGDTGLLPGHTYQYKVKANNTDLGSSADSAGESITTEPSDESSDGPDALMVDILD